MERVRSLASKRPVVIFSKNSCCLCHSIKSFFYGLGVNPAIHELDDDPNGRQMELALSELGCSPAIPAVFIGGNLIGGMKDINTRHLNGTLIPLLRQVQAIWL